MKTVLAAAVLDDEILEPLAAQRRASGIEELDRELTPLSELFVPVFFVLVGMELDLAVLVEPETLGLAALIFGAAVLGKLASGLVAGGPPRSRLTVGVAMVPRVEVGLVFATIGRDLGMIGPEAYGALLAMVIGTTLVTPTLLRRLVNRDG